MFRHLTAIAVAIALTGPAIAQDDPGEKAIEAAFFLMAGSYACRDALGGLAQYQAARTFAVDTLQMVGMSRDQALLAVDEMDEKFTSDPRAASPTLDEVACVETVNEALHDLQVAQARLRR